ncbi:MAG: glycoside hydrolase family 32 protein [Verrucomicrobiales bacterium]|nr:glycoside hydrolase family 32 protein [Verrucomicrobiales bacterium]
MKNHLRTAALILSILASSVIASADGPDPLALNFHLMHPGGESRPADPNGAIYLDGTYHLHYIIAHEWMNQGKIRKGLSWIHVTSPDMLHWTWQKTKLQPTFTGHTMCSGTGFITKDGRPAVIYHGGGSKRNQIAIAKDHRISVWEKPFPIEPKTADGEEPDLRYWDPDLFQIGDTYYAYSGGKEQPLMKSDDLKSWTYVGDFMKHELDDVVLGEDISCGNFFPISDSAGDGTGKWMLLCISHQFGCRYYLGDWDAEAEHFVPEYHGRMNWRQEGQDLNNLGLQSRDIFAPESVLTPDGRRVMWAWSATADEALLPKSIQTLPRELTLGEDGSLRMAPLRELELQRFDLATHENIEVVIPEPKGGIDWKNRTTRIAELNGDAYEIRITVDRKEAERKRFGFRLFSDQNRVGLPIYFQPNNGTLRVGGVEAPFVVSDLPEGEDVELRIFVDKYFVEVFANNRQAIVAADMNWQDASGFDAYSFSKPTTIKKVEIWKMKPTNQGYLEARENRIWEIDTK